MIGASTALSLLLNKRTWMALGLVALAAGGYYTYHRVTSAAAEAAVTAEQNKQLRRDKLVLEARAETAEMQTQLLREAAAESAKLVEEYQTKANDRDQQVKTIVKEVYRDPPKNIEGCEDVLRTGSSAIDRLRELTGHPDGDRDQVPSVSP